MINQLTNRQLSIEERQEIQWRATQGRLPETAGEAFNHLSDALTRIEAKLEEIANQLGKEADR